MPRNAKVRYVGLDPNLVTGHFTHGKVYSAYYIEFWQGVRKGLVAKDDNGEIWDFNQLDQFEILEDPSPRKPHTMRHGAVCYHTGTFFIYPFFYPSDLL